ncbi:YrhK-like protein [Kushneria sinocarnis]|uniref:YrhK-like protein n=1 Tax=Kushneria sinocarnis TaxID=595502 RepID=A0A420WZ15_9GAMM|nr:YrhK family protein [Kushneria sinocarnis]RKR06375.1 YrhK-like protein [Kushneria sinocarnis]
MPHLVTSRQRLFSPSHRDTGHSSHLRWENVNAFTYKLGGLLFVLGSILFFPMLADYQRIGAWLFFLGSLCYLLVTAHDLFEALRYWHRHRTATSADHIELTAALNYVSGSLLFAIGSLLFLPGLALEHAGAWSFIVGSVFFVVGACANLLQLVDAPSKLYMQLFNFTLATFIVGSVLFVVASVPYLIHFDSSGDETAIHRLAAGQFTFASLLFLLGGLFIYWRMFAQRMLEHEHGADRFGKNFIMAIRRENRRERSG